MVLTEKQRKVSATIGKDRYPIPDKNHARLALAFINKGGLSSSEKSKVRAKADKVLGKPHYTDGALKSAMARRGMR